MQRSVRIQSQPYPDYKTSQYYSWWVDGLPLPLFLSDFGQAISPIRYRMLIKMDSDVTFVVASLCDCLKVCHHKTSNILRLDIYQIIKKLPKI